MGIISKKDVLGNLLDCQEKEHPNNTPNNALKYSQSEFENTYYLGYRDVPMLLNKYVSGKRALDFGCGTGRSTRFLNHLGFKTIGLDISQTMLKQAVELDNSSHYIYVKNTAIPLVDSSYDLVFSCFVFFTISNKEEILSIFKEVNRCLKPGGVFVIVTGSEHLYFHDWLSYDVDFPGNNSLLSGSEVKIRLKDLDLNFINYYWTDEDYKSFFKLSYFTLLEQHFPLASNKEGGKNWISETQYPPYVVYVLQK
jgi:ubiquinone/menaquinone biosynthesis C-methylase UbiE